MSPLQPEAKSVVAEPEERKTAEMRTYRWSSLPRMLRVSIVLFFTAHYFLVITSLVLIFYKRLREQDEIFKVETVPDPTTQHFLYVMFGLVYAKYNFEIINFIYFVLFAKDLAYNWLKVVSEFTLILLISMKMSIYYLYLVDEKKVSELISKEQLMGEAFILFIHLSIVGLYFYLVRKLNDKENRRVYNVVVLGKKVLI